MTRTMAFASFYGRYTFGRAIVALCVTGAIGCDIVALLWVTGTAKNLQIHTGIDNSQSLRKHTPYEDNF